MIHVYHLTEENLAPVLEAIHGLIQPSGEFSVARREHEMAHLTFHDVIFVEVQVFYNNKGVGLWVKTDYDEFGFAPGTKFSISGDGKCIQAHLNIGTACVFMTVPGWYK